jgi:hypothetical protein
MTAMPVSLAGQVGRRIVSLVVSVVILVFIRSMLASLPVLRNAQPFGGSGVTPAMIVQVVVDTLILAAMLRFGFQLSGTIRAGSQFFPEGGTIWNLFIITLVAAAAQNVYSELGQALLRENFPLYGWVFLVLILLPLACALVLAALKVNAITEAFFRAVHAAARKCPFCAARISAKAKFCEECGQAVVVAGPGA